MAEAMKDVVSTMLKGIDRYNPSNLPCLQEYVAAQVKENYYDLEANLAILKLYQFCPDLFQPNVAVNILLKALTNMPNTDFVLCKCLLDPPNLDSEVIGLIMYIHQLLETCQFEKFWALVAQNRTLFDPITGFHDAIRKYVCYVVNITYQHIELSLLKDLLNVNDSELAVLAKQHGWEKTDDGYVFINNQEESIKTKNITEKIDFESVAPVLAQYR